MKKISIFILIVGLVGLFSCKKDEVKIEIKPNPDAPVLNLTSGAVITLLEADKDVPVVYTWTPADFGAQVVITYTLEVDVQGNNFADALALGTVNNSTTLSITTGDLDSKLLGFELAPSIQVTPLDLEFRVKATINENVDPVYSSLVAQNITPYYVKIIYPVLFVPGSYQGWNPADSSTSIPSLKQNNYYEGYLWFDIDAAEFKYTQGPSWDVNWGDDGADGTLDPGGANIIAGPAGYYRLKVDITALTHEFLRTDWGLIGDATPGGWDNDTDMTYDPVTKVWTVTLDLTAGKIKFRANNAWDLNYGDNEPNGILDEGGSDIAVPSAGNYTVTLDLSHAEYTYKLVKN